MKHRPFSFSRKLTGAILMDAVLLAVGLLTFAYFHHVRIRDDGPTAISSAAAAQAATATAAPAEAQEPAEDLQPDEGTTDGAVADSAAADGTQTATDASGLFGAKFADKFVSGEPEITETSYRSQNLSVTIEERVVNTSTCFIADIYVRDLDSFRTAVALEYKDNNTSSRKNVMQVTQFSQLTNAVLAISGDNYVYRNAGLLAVRNGLEWANKLPITDDICVMYYDGSMETFSSKSSAAWRDYVNAVYAKGPYQIWCFGPSLLDENGQARTSFNSSVTAENPRSAFGCYEPGHYCFVLVDGRQAGYSVGLTLNELSQLFADLGCQLAYNLDGGDTVAMTFLGKLVNHPENDEPRGVSDVLLIGEPQSSAAPAGDEAQQEG